MQWLHHLSGVRTQGNNAVIAIGMMTVFSSVRLIVYCIIMDKYFICYPGNIKWCNYNYKIFTTTENCIEVNQDRTTTRNNEQQGPLSIITRTLDIPGDTYNGNSFVNYSPLAVPSGLPGALIPLKWVKVWERYAALQSLGRCLASISGGILPSLLLKLSCKYMSVTESSKN